MRKRQDNTLPVLTHILGWFTGFLGPLIVLLASDDKYVKNHARLSLNWQFSLIIYFIISLVLMLFLIGFFLIFVLIFLNLIFTIIAAVKAGDHKLWKYPMAMPFFKVKI